ncbi:hypothetical protein Angca_004708, partial [Angiostrongylus cantonensis]
MGSLNTSFIPAVVLCHFQKFMILYRIYLLSVLLLEVTGKRARASHGHRLSHAKTTSPRFTRKFSKVGSIERTSLFRSTVFGAAAGYLTFRAGRHVINDPGKPIV